MERVNLNVPSEIRRKLRAIARRQRRAEAEVARDLIIAAIEREEREEFYRQMEAALTPAAHKRMLQVVDALERLDGR